MNRTDLSKIPKIFVATFQPDLPSADEQLDFFVRQWESDEEDDKALEDRTKTEAKKERKDSGEGVEPKV